MLKREHIPVGREHAITRDELSRLTGLGDRKLRKEIARLRSEDDGTNMVIVSTSDGSGYFRTDKLDEIDHFIAENTKRFRALLQTTIVTRAIADRLRKRQMYGEGLG